MRIAIFGGTFDPLHSGHKEIIRQLASLFDKVIVVPTTIRYYKTNSCMYSFNYRCEAVQKFTKTLGLEGYHNIEVDDVERDVPSEWRFIETLQHLKARYPQDELFVTLGGDSFITFPTWEKYEEIIKIAKLVIFGRPGYDTNKFPDIPHTYYNLDIDMSSTKLREKIEETMNSDDFELDDFFCEVGFSRDADGNPIEF